MKITENSGDFSVFCTGKQMSAGRCTLFCNLLKISIEILLAFVYNASMVLRIKLQRRKGTPSRKEIENYVHSKRNSECLPLRPQW